MNWLKRFLSSLLVKFDINGVLGLLALVISIITMYFQFFNVSHKVLYTFLAPSMGGEKMSIPIIYKNDGNQNELILSANIEMEVIPGDTVENYFRRIGDDNKKHFPLILTPGEYKIITLVGDYLDYFDGMVEYSPSGEVYREIRNIENLSVVITIEFISDHGIAKVRRTIGKVSFNKDHSFNKFYFEPIKLVELKDTAQVEMTGGVLINRNVSFSVSDKDSLTAEQIAHLKMMSHKATDSGLKKAILDLLQSNSKRFPPKP